MNTAELLWAWAPTIILVCLLALLAFACLESHYAEEEEKTKEE